jgi:uncharacterized repeat protein (TIGR04052 family)
MRLVLAVVLAACAAPDEDAPDPGAPREEREVAVQIAAEFDGVPVSCRTAVRNVGTAAVQVRPTDLRLFVHDLAWRWGADERAPWTLDADPDWVAEGAALIDHEDGEEACVGGTTGTNDTVRGRADLPVGLTIADLELTLGLPPDLNHAQLATSGPLADAGVFLSTTVGRAHFQLGLDPVTGEPEWPLRVVATGCTTPSGQPGPCVAENTLRITIPGVTVDEARVVAALDVLLRGSDVSRNAVSTLPGGGTVDTLPGCQSTPNDADCPPVLDAYGLGRSEPAWWRAAP